MMSVSFDWEFEEEESRSQRRSGGDFGRPHQRRRWLRRGSVLLVLLAVASLAAYAWYKSRMDTLKTAEAELQSVVDLELKTIADGDLELFRSRQDPADSRWEAWQIARYINKADGFVPAPGLVRAEPHLEVKQVQVLGQSGRVQVIHWFDDPLRETTDPLPFHATWFYRQDDQGVWFHVAPADDYKGIPYSWYGSRLVIRATEADAELLDPIARDVSVLMAKGCQQIGCPEGLRYTLSFWGDLGARVQDNWWTLPALYLTGQPEGDQARAAWEHALKLWMVEALAQATTGDGAVSDRVLYRQLVVRLQAELGLPADSESEPRVPDVGLIADALINNRQHSFEGLWGAEYESRDPEEVRLLETEVALFLQWIEGQVGRERLFELFSIMGDQRRLDTALLASFGLSHLDLEMEWFAFLLEVTGVETMLASELPAGVQALELPPLPPEPPVAPGDEVAFICGNRVWVSNADGSNSVPLTADGQRFNTLSWSPNGRWLLTVWQHSFEASALYLLAADGSGGRLLTDSPTQSVFPVGWSPDGRYVVFFLWRVAYRWRSASAVGREAEIWAIDVETTEMYRLPGIPLWSSDGQNLIYASRSADNKGISIWLAEADPAGKMGVGWENARQIVDDTQIGPRGGWSPDNSKLALTQVGDDPSANAVVIYDLATESLTPLITAEKLTQIVLSSDDDFVTDGTDLSIMSARPLYVLRPLGWSADGGRLAVWAQGTTGGSGAAAPTLLVVVPLDGTAPRVLAFGAGGLFGGPNWSPANPDHLIFAWQTEPGLYSGYAAFLFDLNLGSLYSVSESWYGSWSPDGSWVAFSEPDRVTIVDDGGQPHYVLKRRGSCSDPSWNPASDLSSLDNPTVFNVRPVEAHWRISNVRTYRDHAAQELHIWGEVVNQTGDDQRVVALIPVVLDENGDPIDAGYRTTFPSGYKELMRTVSLADGRSLPFGLTLHTSVDVQFADNTEITIHVAAESAERTRNDLDIPYDGFDLSEWPDAFFVNGVVENPGPELAEYLMVVATVYDVNGDVIGLGWRSETDYDSIAEGRRDFEVEVSFSETVTDLRLNVGSYKVQLFGR